jgi:hypothetical protein
VCNPSDDIAPDKGAVTSTMHTTYERRLTMPHILTTILTQVAVGLIEAALVRLFMQLWKTFAASGRPVTAYA